MTGLVTFVFLGSGMVLIIAAKDAIEMDQNFDLEKQTHFILCVVELITVILFIVPRTGIIGSFLLVAFLGGAIATHL